MSFRFDDRMVRSALLIPGQGSHRFASVSSDTRTLQPGSLFVALRGERFDGHDMLDAARAAGASGAVVRHGTPRVAGLEWYEVDDTLRAWGDLARERRRAVNGPVIAATGQNGKTSTREMVAAVLATRWKTHRNRANNNNLVGVPLSILEAPEDAEAMVIEAGANVRGEIARYREIIEPDIAIVTNAGSGHLAGFGSVSGVVEEKLSLIRGVPTAIIGMRPPELASGAAELGVRRIVTAGLEPSAMVHPDRLDITTSGRPRVRVDAQEFLLGALGEHQAANAMFAWAVARELGIDPARAAAALEHLEIPGGRGEVIQQGKLTILHDAYNANPESFEALIELVRVLRHGRRLVFVAGTMRELGDTSPALHSRIAAGIASLHPEVVGLVGDFVPAFAPYREGYEGSILGAPDSAALASRLAAELRGDELVVLKGSRGTALETILPAILPRAQT